MELASGHAVIIPISKLSPYLASFLCLFFSSSSGKLLENEHRAAVHLPVKPFECPDRATQRDRCTSSQWGKHTDSAECLLRSSMETTRRFQMSFGHILMQKKRQLEDWHTRPRQTWSQIFLWFVVWLYKKGGQHPRGPRYPLMSQLMGSQPTASLMLGNLSTYSRNGWCLFKAVVETPFSWFTWHISQHLDRRQQTSHFTP